MLTSELIAALIENIKLFGDLEIVVETDDIDGYHVPRLAVVSNPMRRTGELLYDLPDVFAAIVPEE